MSSIKPEVERGFGAFGSFGSSGVNQRRFIFLFFLSGDTGVCWFFIS